MARHQLACIIIIAISIASPETLPVIATSTRTTTAINTTPPPNSAIIPSPTSSTTTPVASSLTPSSISPSPTTPSSLTPALTSFTTSSSITPALTSSTSSSIIPALTSFTTSSSLTPALTSLTTLPSITPALTSFTTSASITPALTSFTTSSSITPALTSFTTSSSITPALTSFTTLPSITPALTSFTTLYNITPPLTSFTTPPSTPPLTFSTTLSSKTTTLMSSITPSPLSSAAPFLTSSNTMSPTTNTTKLISSVSAPARTFFPTLIPDTFYYNCSKEGEIKIMNEANSFSNITIKYLNQSSSNCSDPTTEDDGSITISNCIMNTTVTIVLEANHTDGIVGRWHSNTFQIKCEDVNIEPYLLNVTATKSVINQETPHVISMATEPTPSPVSSLTMTIKEGNNNIADAYIGQALTVAIGIPNKTTIKPTECMASGNDKSVILWQEAGCTHNDELFGEKWINKAMEVTNTMYGFRFVGASKSITITCMVLVCPDGYRGPKCDLTCKSRKKKRNTELSTNVTIQKATTSITIRDALMTSRAERLRYELDAIIGLTLATVVLVKMKLLQR